MNLSNIIIPMIIVIFFGYRFYKFKKIKNQIPELLSQGAIIIDVRSNAEFNGGANPSSINIPLEKIANETSKYDKNKKIILCCASGTRSGMALGILKAKGFTDVMNAGPWTNTLG